MKVFVVNCGSSSIKFQLFDMADESVMSRGVMERVGTEDATVSMSVAGQACKPTAAGQAGRDHHTGLKAIVSALVDAGAIASVSEIEGVGHRVVHGAAEINESRRIDADVLKVIKDNCALAPLHNPANLAGIEAAFEVLPDVPHVAVFDTAFLADLPPTAYRYAVPEKWYKDYHVRKYGFHGTSHRYVTLRMAELLGKQVDEVNLVTAHLGNGCSMTAVAGGKACDHSMGMTPLEGLMMGTRSGDIDPAVIFYLAGQGVSYDQISQLLNKSAGLLGVSGRSNDMRDLLAAAEDGDERAELAVDMFVYRIAKYAGAYQAILPSTDALVLTGGIGENCPAVREKLCRRLAGLGVVVSATRNDNYVGSGEDRITADDSALAIWVVPTNEELMIARDTQAVAAGKPIKSDRDVK